MLKVNTDLSFKVLRIAGRKVIYIWLKGKYVGKIDRKVYVTTRKYPLHFYFQLEGYPISESVLQFLREKQVERIKIIEWRKDVYTRYEVPLGKYLRGKLLHEKGQDRQKCVPLEKLRLIICKDGKG